MEELLSVHPDNETVDVTTTSIISDRVQPIIMTTPHYDIEQQQQHGTASSTPLDRHHLHYLQNNTSTTSSTYKIPNDSCHNHPSNHVLTSEPTINTQFALRELSFMFASPVVAPPQQQQQAPPSHIEPISESVVTVPAITTTGSPSRDHLIQHRGHSNNNDVLPLSSSSPLPNHANVSSALAFDIYHDDDSNKDNNNSKTSNCEMTVNGSTTLQNDNNQYNRNAETLLNQTNFTIYEENDDDDVVPKHLVATDTLPNGNGFTIFCDDPTFSIPTHDIPKRCNNGADDDNDANHQIHKNAFIIFSDDPTEMLLSKDHGRNIITGGAIMTNNNNNHLNSPLILSSGDTVDFTFSDLQPLPKHWTKPPLSPEKDIQNQTPVVHAVTNGITGTDSIVSSPEEECPSHGNTATTFPTILLTNELSRPENPTVLQPQTPIENTDPIKESVRRRESSSISSIHSKGDTITVMNVQLSNILTTIEQPPSPPMVVPNDHVQRPLTRT
jgi:hypothetical protein